MVGIHQIAFRQRARLIGHCLLCEWPQRPALSPKRFNGFQ
jgi:hypothetical protein